MKWIKCSEKMPEKDSCVLVFVNHPYYIQHMRVTEFNGRRFMDIPGNKGERLYSAGSNLPKEFVTHWMELPEEPEQNVAT